MLSYKQKFYLMNIAIHVSTINQFTLNKIGRYLKVSTKIRTRTEPQSERVNLICGKKQLI